MSRNVHVDIRQSQLRNLDALIQTARSTLQATRSTVSCGRADVKLSNIQVDSSAFQRARAQDKLDVKDTGVLESKLTADGPSFKASALGDWRPVPVEVHDEFVVTESGSDENNLRLVEDLECAGLDGARLLIFEETDERGNTSYLLGLDDVLFDDDGNWKSDTAKQAYESFLGQAMAARELALEVPGGNDGEQPGIRDALELAGLHSSGAKELQDGRRHQVFTNTGESGSKPAGKTFKLGGGE